MFYSIHLAKDCLDQRQPSNFAKNYHYPHVPWEVQLVEVQRCCSPKVPVHALLNY